MPKRVLITGAAGRIGTVLRNHLSDYGDYELTLVDIKPTDGGIRPDVARNYDGLLDAMRGQDAVVHLAWDGRENFREKSSPIPGNKKMAENVYKAALETNPSPKLIVASSVHAVGGYTDFTRPPYSYIAKREFEELDIMIMPEMITSDMAVFPDSPYGASKVYIEALGRYYSTKGLQVMCIRFGEVNPEDKILEEEGWSYHSSWLSHRDCAQFVSRCIEVDLPRSYFAVFFAVSGNAYRVFDITDAKGFLGYSPQDDAEKFFRNMNQK